MVISINTSPRGRTLRKKAILAALFLSAGASFNILVCWTLALGVDLDNAQSSVTSWKSGDEDVVISTHTYPGATLVWIFRTRIGPGERQPEVASRTDEFLPPWGGLEQPSERYASGEISMERRTVKAYGLPRRAMWFAYDTYLDEAADVRHTMKAGIEIARDPPWLDPLGLPLGVIRSGFLINSLFHGSILWLVIRGPVMLKRQARRRRGMCLFCGYQLAEDHGDSVQGCPECGWRRKLTES